MAALEAEKWIAEHSPDLVARRIEQQEEQMIGAWD
jgi:hypothetical protein